MMHQNPKPADREKELLDLLRSAGVDPRSPRAHQHFDERWSRSTPWYNRGWVWLVMAMVILVVLAVLFAHLGSDVRLSADATGQQTNALREQTNVMRQQGHWLNDQLDAIGRYLSDILRGIDRLVQMLQHQMTSH